MHIDWSTLALQTINVLVLVWLLARFLFRPVKTIIAERHAAAEKLLADAAATRAQAEADAADVRQRLQSATADSERMMAEARIQAEAERARLLQQAHDAAIHMQDEAKAAIEIDRAIVERTLGQKACDLAIVIADRLLRRLPARTATAGLLESLTTAVAEIPEAERRILAAAGGLLVIVAAVPLDEGQQTACRDMLGRVLGQVPTLVFQTNAALIAGVELHTSGMLIRNTWQADLEHIAGELHQDQQDVAESEHLV
jgi:F-type H+-transporting ATPase subunit b